MRVLILALFFISCNSLKAPKLYVRPAHQMLRESATLQDAELARPVIYFASFDKRVEQYRIEYITPVGKVPFMTVFKPQSSIKDTVRSAPCYVRVQALGDEKSRWSNTIFIP